MLNKLHHGIWGWSLLLIAALLSTTGYASTTAEGQATILVPCGPAWASYGTGTSELAFAADTPGTDGNNILVIFQDPGAPNSPLSVSVTGSTITVILATDSNGNLITTAAQVAAAISANPAAAALVDAYTAEDASGLVLPGTADLEGGTDCSVGAETLPWGTVKALWSTAVAE